MASASEQMGVPVMYERDDEGGVRKDRMMRSAIAPDARLDPNDPELRSKLGQFAASLKAQVGGDWRVEERETEVGRVGRKE